MNAAAHITYDRPYFEAFYADWLVYRSKWRRFAIPFAVAITAAGVATFLVMPQQNLFGLFLLIAGLYNVYESTTYRKRWISARIKDLQADKTVELNFCGDEISIETPNSSGKFNVAALSNVIPTPNGMFLIPQSGVSIFVPRASIEPTDAFPSLIEALMSAIEGTKKNNDSREPQ